MIKREFYVVESFTQTEVNFKQTEEILITVFLSFPSYKIATHSMTIVRNLFNLPITNRL